MITDFGRTRRGARVRHIALRRGALSAGVLTLGAILQEMRFGTRRLTLGARDLAAYDDGPMRYFGAVIGPVAGRIAGARGRIGDRAIAMPANEGPNALHSGAAGLHAKVWQIVEARPAAVTLSVAVPAGEGGLPGARRFGVRYALEPDGLRLTLSAETDAATWVTLTQHSYWHPGGRPGIDGNRLQIAAARYLPIDAATLPTGEIAQVAGTRFDFRAPRGIAPQDLLDHCFCLADAPRPLARAARLVAPDGMALTLETEAPGLQIHTGDGVSVPARLAPGGRALSGRPGLALEPQDWPDAPGRAGFPPIELAPGARWRRESVFRVARGGDG